ncbi:Hypothetical protein SCLAV_2787 [Streptomyces clavuligerus]|uniref:Uncharacterized protein n=1 Tax=Streptomyces clavuligerus TaxID=1901 RepID=E2PVE5_STRCL|nr:Hypothetical protein SCLAV_2787 [Streptomyces clavuligerus]
MPREPHPHAGPSRLRPVPGSPMAGSPVRGSRCVAVGAGGRRGPAPGPGAGVRGCRARSRAPYVPGSAAVEPGSEPVGVVVRRAVPGVRDDEAEFERAAEVRRQCPGGVGAGEASAVGGHGPVAEDLEDHRAARPRLVVHTDAGGEPGAVATEVVRDGAGRVRAEAVGGHGAADGEEAAVARRLFAVAAVAFHRTPAARRRRPGQSAEHLGTGRRAPAAGEGGLGPVGVVPAEAVAAVGHHEPQLAGAGEVGGEPQRRVARGAQPAVGGHRAVPQYAEDHRAARRHLVVHTHVHGEGAAGAAEVVADGARRVHPQTAGVGGAADGEGAAVARGLFAVAAVAFHGAPVAVRRQPPQIAHPAQAVRRRHRLTGCHPVHHGAVRGHGRGDRVGGGAVLPCPQVPEGVRGGAAESDRLGGRGDGPGGGGLVGQGHRTAAVGEGFGHDDQPAGARDHGALAAQRVLVHRDDLAIGQDLQGRGGRGAQIAADEERGGHLRPEAEVGAVLGVGHPAVAHFEHVGVVPGAGPGVRGQLLVAAGDAQHAVPGVGDVPGGAPGAAVLARPLPGGVLAPLADAEQDLAAGGPQRLGHGAVALPGVDAVVVAVVVLEIVHAPGGPQGRVPAFVPEAAGEALDIAGPGARAGVDAELQPFGVDIVGQCLDAAGEAHRVGDEVARGVALGERPAVVEIHVAVSGVPQPLGDEGVGDALDHRLVELGAAVGGVPVVEAHGGCGRERGDACGGWGWRRVRVGRGGDEAEEDGGGREGGRGEAVGAVPDGHGRLRRVGGDDGDGCVETGVRGVRGCAGRGATGVRGADAIPTPSPEHVNKRGPPGGPGGRYLPLSPGVAQRGQERVDAQVSVEERDPEEERGREMFHVNPWQGRRAPAALGGPGGGERPGPGNVGAGRSPALVAAATGALGMSRSPSHPEFSPPSVSVG